MLGRLAAANITDAFVVGGDNDPVGEFTDALGLLQAMTEVGHGLTEIGIGGYPRATPASVMSSSGRRWSTRRRSPPAS